MLWDDWAPTDAAIRADFGYPVQADEAAAAELAALLPATNRLRDLGVELRNRRNVTVLGCGPGLARLPAGELAGQVLVAADGATSRLRELGAAPHVVVTDLDGRAEDLEWAARRGSLMVVHAHGDNRDAIARLVPRLGPQVYGTAQCRPRPEWAPLESIGGFTDGDRAVVLCEHLGVRAARLVGFEFDAEPSPYSHRWDPATKPRKLAWAERIVGEVHARGKVALTKWVA